MFDDKRLRTFLCQVPKPAKVLVHCDGEAREMIPGSGITWASMAQTIVALGDTVRLVELYSKDGQLLRALPADDEQARPAQQAALSAVTTDPETARLTHFANLLFRSLEFTDRAFTKMVEIFELQTRRTEAIEARLERTESDYRRNLNQQIKDAFDEAARAGEGEPENPIVSMAREFFGGFAAGNGNGAHDTIRPPAKTNGNGKGSSNGAQREAG